MNRAERRHHRRRLDARAKAIAESWGKAQAWYRIRHNRQCCSCASCGNRRRWEGPTLAERKHNLNLLEQMYE